ncbi:MAG: hypothetical protein IBJ12_13510 [Sphingomonadaceae bacterium]|nr:hypothetical protein [Sphingomonadaceae bacterium]
MRLAALLVLLALPSVSHAQNAEAPSTVSTFAKLCLAGGTDPAARPAALEAAIWTKDQSSTINVELFAFSRAIERNYDFSKPENVEQWSGVIDDRPAKVVLANFPSTRRYRNLCALTINGIENAMPYGGELRKAFKTFGIGGKSVDLVHYYEFAGKLAPNKHPVRGEIFSRSLATGEADSMHIYIAY